MKQLLPSLVYRLAAAATPEQREQLIRSALQADGFEWLSYATETRQRDGWRPAGSFTVQVHHEVRPGEMGRLHGDVDPRVQEASQSSMPLVWDRAWIEARMSAPDAALRSWGEDLRLSSAGSGVLFNLASADKQVPQRTIIDLMSPHPARDWLTEPVLTQALMLGLGLHEFCTRHGDACLLPPTVTRRDPATLPPVQQQIAHHLLQGLGDKEIAALLHMSSHTVDYHMRQLRQRFAARNRVQIVSALRQSTHAAMPAHA